MFFITLKTFIDKKIDSIYILPNKLSSKIQAPKKHISPEIVQMSIKINNKNNWNEEKEKSISWKDKIIFFIFFSNYFFFFIWFIYACWGILDEATTYWEPTIWVNENLESMRPSAPLTRKTPWITFLRRPGTPIPRSSVIAFFRDEYPEVPWATLSIDKFNMIQDTFFDFIVHVKEYFEQNPAELIMFCDPSITAEEKVKIFINMVEKYKNTKYYNWKHPSQEKILHMVVRKVIDSLEKGLTDSKNNDFIAQFIKIIKVEKHETWGSFWKKIWQSLWKKK
jgi:hypothetical protein